MDSIPTSLDDLVDALRDVVSRVDHDDLLRGSSDSDLIAVLTRAGALSRLADALTIEATAAVIARCDAAAHADRLTARTGCASVAELVERTTRVGRRTAADVVTAARAVRREVAPSTGETLPPDLPELRRTMLGGEVGLDGVVAVTRTLRPLGAVERLAADTELAASARGDQEPPASAERLRECAEVWVGSFDPDGAEPVDTRATRRRGLVIGRLRDGSHPIHGNLLPEVAAHLELQIEALLNPRATGPRFVEVTDEPREEQADTRTRPQKQHDALAIILTAAAASGDLPTIAGAAPTLVVTVREEDLLTGRGRAHLDAADATLPLTTAAHIGCAGFIQRIVHGDNGRVVSLGVPDRLFTLSQRRAILARDGGCLIPGCHVPASRCEVHHVTPHARGGPTHVDNGVLLCWHHHRTIDTGGWQIRIRDGVPEIRGPYWWDAQGLWRPATKSPTRIHNLMAATAQ